MDKIGENTMAVSQAKDESWDIMLPNLGYFYFVKRSTDDGVALMYVRKKDYNPDAAILDPYPANYYCRSEIKLTAFEKLCRVDLDTKVAIKTGELRKWLIAQDGFLTEIQGCRRSVEL